MASIDLPWDITIEIFSRLPVKSLMRFKCVSISFYNLISNDPLFRKKHIYHQSKSFKKVILTSGSFLTYEGTSVYPRQLISLPLEGDVRVDRINELQVPYREGDIKCRQIVFYNTCDGLFCMSMSGGGNALLWNPTTRQVRIFQSCPSYIPKQSWIGYFLAHDSSSDVYKLLGLSISGHNTYKLYFYSTETGMWRYIEESSPCDYVKYNGKTTIVNGAFHWLGSNEEHFRMPHFVVSLDISDETYGTLALPEAICDNSKGPKLCELKGKLCIFSQHIQDLHWDLWVMNEYGDVDSMMRMFRMSCVDILDKFSWPFHMLEDDTLVVYKPEDTIRFYKDGRVLRINSVRKYQYDKTPYVYFESLISPHTCLHVEEVNQKIVPNGFFATTSHSSDSMPENAFVATNFSATTNRGEHVVTRKRWPKSCLQRLCFCKSF